MAAATKTFEPNLPFKYSCVDLLTLIPEQIDKIIPYVSQEYQVLYFLFR